MKYFFKLFLVSAVLAAPLSVSAFFDATQWQYRKDISGHRAGITKVALDDEVFSNAKGDLSDLRIIAADGAEIPYLLLIGSAKDSKETIQPKLLNNTFVTGRNSSVILDFGANPPEVNQLNLSTPSRNFQRQVVIYGSDAQPNWQVIKNNGYIYDFTDTVAGVNAKDTSIEFSPSIFRFLKIEIDDPENKPVVINSVSTYQYIKESAREVGRQPQFEVSLNADKNETDIIIDLGVSGVPVTKAELTLSDENFNRGVKIYAGDDKTSWNFLGSEYVFRYRTPKFNGEDLTLSFAQSGKRYLKVSIVNRDDKPLTVTNVYVPSVYREIAFQSEDQEVYGLFYGNAQARQPEYDFKKYFQYLDASKAVRAEISAQQNNESYVAPILPLSERMPYLMPTALVIAALLLFGLVFLFFRKQ
ncbi:MAG: DUF3999 family protein [bacterium]|nr:DUF3999 family protein [bacterium]